MSADRKNPFAMLYLSQKAGNLGSGVSEGTSCRMRILIVFLCVAGLGLMAMPDRASAQTAQSPFLQLAALEQLATDDPVAALGEIDAAVAAFGQTDPRFLFDLFSLKAKLLQQLDRPDEAAPLLVELGRFASRQRDLLERDPVPFYDAAAGLFETANRPLEARAAVQLILEEQRDGGLPGSVLAATLDRLAALSEAAGDNQAAATHRQAAETARADTGATDPTRGDDGKFREVEVFYATDRARSGDPEPSEFYGYGRGALELGIATVTIPESHELGVVEAPSIWRLEFGPNAAKHVVLQSVVPVEADQFYASMTERLRETGTTDAFVFVHGYNVRFDQAAKRAAQMAYDMNFPGVPVLYSWPSRGSTKGYISDTAVVRLSGRRLSRFLDDLVHRSGAHSIHIVAHSMGNRALTDALELLSLRHGLKEDSPPVFEQVLFAAPDVDADLFAEMLPTIRPVARRLTLYASQEDWALSASRQMHGNAPRAGQGGQDMLADTHIDSVDMSELGEDMLAHSYFADDSSALADIVALFWRNADPARRCGLERVELPGGAVPIWFYKVGDCADRTLVEVMTHLQREHVTDMAGAQRIVDQTVTDPSAAQRVTPFVARLMEN